MIKFTRYLISLIVMLGLFAGQRGQFSQSYSPAYAEFSRVISRNESSINCSSTYQYGSKSFYEKILLIFIITYRALQDFCSDQVRTSFKIRRLLFKEIDIFSSRHLYYRFFYPSKLTFPGLYLA